MGGGDGLPYAFLHGCTCCVLPSRMRGRVPACPKPGRPCDAYDHPSPGWSGRHAPAQCWGGGMTTACQLPAASLMPGLFSGQCLESLCSQTQTLCHSGHGRSHAHAATLPPAGFIAHPGCLLPVSILIACLCSSACHQRAVTCPQQPCRLLGSCYSHMQSARQPNAGSSVSLA